ncbi:MAG: FAD-dependent monooxygenase [Pseudomonadota bacterium]
MSDLNTDVLIVGAGPVGLISALLFERLGVSCMIVERREGLHTAPQAHVISSRSLEICRAVGVADGPIRSLGPAPQDIATIRWVESLAGRDLGVFSMTRRPEKIAQMFMSSPTPTTNLAQDKFEAVLADHVSAATSILFGHEWTGFEEKSDGCISGVLDPDGAVKKIASRFIIGADGARSVVRKAIGSQMEGPHQIQNYINVHFHANLRESLRGREGLLYWVMTPETYGAFIAHDIDENWIFMKNVDRPMAPEDVDHDRLLSQLRQAIGADIDLEIKSVSTWCMTAQVASSYRKDRVFLAGDAAHRFPPTGGIGMNTGFQDALNLAWKMAMVFRGWDPQCLDTYESERRPVALRNSSQSHENYEKMVRVDAALDADGDGVATSQDFDTVLADTELSQKVQAAVEEQAEHFDMSGLDLGVCYTGRGIIYDGQPPQADNPVTTYTPSTTPGARLPHSWLVKDGERISTLDLVQLDRFLVLHAEPNEPLEAAIKALREEGFPLASAMIGEGGVASAADDAFAALFAPDTALLVRPDGHIAARLRAERAAQELPQTMETLLIRERASEKA